VINKKGKPFCDAYKEKPFWNSFKGKLLWDPQDRNLSWFLLKETLLDPRKPGLKSS
jgi:hypothetical protein